MTQTNKLESIRLLCGSIYLGGFWRGLSILGYLRRDQYKAKSPETGLDLDEVATHAAQAVAISLAAAILAVAIGILQLALLGLVGVATTRYWGATSEASRDFWQFLIGFLGFAQIVFTLTGGGIIAYELIYWRWTNGRHFLKRFYNPQFHLKFLAPLTNFLKQRIMEPEPKQNIITFGGFEPFLGAGETINGGWTLCIERQNTTQPRKIIDIPLQNFYDTIDKSIGDRGLPHLQQFSHLLVNGYELQSDSHILPQQKMRPVATLSEAEIWAIGHGNLEKDQRTYRIYRYTDETRGMVFSYFIRFYNLGMITFVEGTPCILNSIDRHRFSLAAALKDNTFSRILKTIGLALILSISGLYAAVALWRLFLFVYRLVSWWLLDVRQGRAARWGEEYNYGLSKTFRETIAAPIFQNYYGIQDLIMYKKTIEEAIFDGIVTLLKENGVDTTQFETNANIVMNNGVMVNGGQFTATQVTAGQGSASIMNTTPEKQRGRTQQLVHSVINRVVPGQ